LSRTKNRQPENKMGVMPINKLLLSMAVPMMISMLVQALYNVVDSIFVSQLNENALTAVSLAFPVQNIMIAVCTGTGVGINAFVSKALGSRDQEKANRTANNGLLLAFFTSAAFAVLIGSLGRLFFSIQTDDTQIADYGTSYIRIVGIISFGMVFQITLERLLQSTGKTIYSMITQTAGAVINIILDPIMIFGLLGFPRMEVAGAAMATVIGQVCASALALYFNLRHNPELTINLKKYRLCGKTIAEIYSVGLPSILMASIGSVMNFFMNRILISFTSTAVAVFGVYFKLQSFVFMPVFGLNGGIVPIIAYNYGARRPDRIMKTAALGLAYAAGIMAAGTIIFLTIPRPLLMLFNASEAMLEIGIPALRIISLCFIFAAAGITMSSVFQAMGKGTLSLIMSVFRQLVVLLPAAYLLSKISLSAIWWAFFIAEVCCFGLGVYFFLRLYNEKIKPLGEGE